MVNSCSRFIQKVHINSEIIISVYNTGLCVLTCLWSMGLLLNTKVGNCTLKTLSVTTKEFLLDLSLLPTPSLVEGNVLSATENTTTEDRICSHKDTHYSNVDIIQAKSDIILLSSETEFYKNSR